MRNYRSSAGTDVRVDYGTELVEGLKLFPETTPLATDIEALTAALETAASGRKALRKPLVKARVALRLANYLADQEIRSCGKAAEIADGGRRGPVFDALFPEGVGPVVAPAGARQIKPTEKLLERLTHSKNAAVIAFAQQWQPKLAAALAKLQAAADGHEAARKADAAAFVQETALREEHAHTVDKLMGAVRAAFPRDRAKQDLVFPVVDDASSAAEPEEPDAPDPAGGGKPA